MSDNPAAIWERIAPWWDQAIGEGNEFQRELIMPATDRLLGITEGQSSLAGRRILDVCCGNGNYSRMLGRRGANVVACDVSESFLAAARQRTSAADGAIAYHRIDATDESALRSLGESSFNAIVCSMAMMDLPSIDPLLRAGRALLRAEGRFVFSVCHPCFNSNFSVLTAELINEGAGCRQEFGVRITRYREPNADLCSGIINQPEPHWMYHRSLSDLLGSAFSAGFVMDALEEPAFSGETGGKNAFAWKKRPSIPPALVVRLRPR